MPSAKSLAYDAHGYLTPVIYNGITAAGATGLSGKFVAFTGLQLRRAVLVATTANSTSATTPLIFSKSGTATTTTTFTNSISSASTAGVEHVLSTAISLAQGDTFWFSHGTDATIVATGTVECYPTPGATLAAP